MQITLHNDERGTSLTELGRSIPSRVKCDSRAPSAIHKIRSKRIGINRFARDGAIARVRREHQLDPTRGWQSVWGAAEDGNGFVKKWPSGAVLELSTTFRLHPQIIGCLISTALYTSWPWNECEVHFSWLFAFVSKKLCLRLS
jgi:hypothetical protein